MQGVWSNVNGSARRSVRFALCAAHGARRLRCLRSCALFFVGLLLPAVGCLLPTVQAQYAQPPERVDTGNTPAAILQDVRIEQRLGAQLPLDASFRDETGRIVKLGDYFGARPVVFALVYYKCPMLCNQVLSGMVGGLRSVSFTPGKEFDVVVVSFDPREGPVDAAQKKRIVVGDYHRPETAAGWHFLTGDKAAIDSVATAAGFHYAFDARTNQFAHASAIMLATPAGKLSHYFYGIDPEPRGLRLGLVEASAGKVGSPVDQLLLYCYHYDPTTGRYGPVIMNFMRLGGLVTVLGVVALILGLRRARGLRPTAGPAAAGGTAL
ncbi:MAG TPA: SCO family protein [Pyrinomonadaceae bacterium]|jgi:protein SCO1/2